MVELQRMRMRWHGYGDGGERERVEWKGSDLGEEVGEGKEAIKRKERDIRVCTLV